MEEESGEEDGVGRQVVVRMCGGKWVVVGNGGGVVTWCILDPRDADVSAS
jgi:hypothetical protein